MSSLNVTGNVPAVLAALTAAYDAAQVPFTVAVQAALADDTILDWRGGDFTLKAPVVLDVTTNKFTFGIRLNGAKVTCDFNDATKRALMFRVPTDPSTGNPYTDVNWRNLTLCDGNFQSATPYAGAFHIECPTTASGIYSAVVSNIRCEGNSDRNFVFGNVFELIVQNCATTGGGFLEAKNNFGSGQGGILSTLYIDNPEARDSTKDALLLSGSTAFTEARDVTITKGYFVNGQKRAIYAPAGITSVDNVGLEANCRDGSVNEMIYIGSAGGSLHKVKALNPDAKGSTLYLVNSFMGGNPLTFYDCHILNEGAGTNTKLCNVAGSGTVFLNLSGTSSDVDGLGGSLLCKVATYA